MGVWSDKHVENKQISKEDIIRLADVMEEYKKEWIQRANAEKEYNSSIPTKTELEYDSYKSIIKYNILFKDGRNLTQVDRKWFVDNIQNLNDIKRIYIYYTLMYYDKYESQGFDKSRHDMELDMSFFIEKDEFNPIMNFSIDSYNLDDESNILHKQIQNLKNEYGDNYTLTVPDILKFVGIIESHKSEYDSKSEEEKLYVGNEPKKNSRYSYLESSVSYTIGYYDGKDKTESDYNWFVENIQNTKNIRNINIGYKLHFSDNDLHKSLYANIDFRTYDENYSSKVTYGVDSDNMDIEADSLYSRIDSVFRNNPIRYNNTIKRRNLRIQGFSIAVGIILSYIIYLILNMVLKDSSGVFYGLIHNKNVIVFGQWIVAIIGGNVFASWYINMLYKPMLPNKQYVRYDSKNNKSIYKDKIDEFIADSEIQIGKFYDLKEKRNLIEKLYKYSLIVIVVQIIISIILFLVLK